MSRLIDIYLAVFYPAAIGKASNYVIAKSGSTIYNQNAGLDINRNGVITISDIEGWLILQLPKEAQNYESKKKAIG